MTMRQKQISFWTWLLCLALLSLTRCSHYSTGSAVLDKVINAGYGKWEGLINPQLDLCLKELERLNPYYDQGSRESITQPIQKVILCLITMRKKDGVVVELGSWTGGGVLVMAPFLTHDQSYHAVDTFNAEHMPDKYVRDYLKGRKHLDVFNDNIAPVRNKVVIHQGFTSDVAATWPKDLKIDLLFIDADHSYKGVSSEWKNWSPFMRKDGVIAFHDYYVKSQGGHGGVRKFIDESIIPKAGNRFQYVEGLAWYVVK
jgi:predicted O-methyltransferase YrrM